MGKFVKKVKERFENFLSSKSRLKSELKNTKKQLKALQIENEEINTELILIKNQLKEIIEKIKK